MAFRAIYEPKGRAREYAPLALNLYSGCTYGCAYCYVPGALHMRRPEAFVTDAPKPRKILDDLFHDLAEMQAAGDDREVLLCFACDPYHAGDTRLTRSALELFRQFDRPVNVLTKNPQKLLDTDKDLFCEDCSLRLRVGTTLSFLSDELHRKWERRAPSPMSRLTALHEIDDIGVDTWISLEPVLHIGQACGVLRRVAWGEWREPPEIKIGPLNHAKAGYSPQKAVRALTIQAEYLNAVTELRVMFKQDFRKYAQSDQMELGSVQNEEK